MRQRVPFDQLAYDRRAQEGPCFVCAIANHLPEYRDRTLRGWIYQVGRALEAVVPTERLYVLSLGSQQANRHVHWHLAPLPPGVPYADQQLAALMKSRGLVALPAEESSRLAAAIRARLLAPSG